MTQAPGGARDAAAAAAAVTTHSGVEDRVLTAIDDVSVNPSLPGPAGPVPVHGVQLEGPVAGATSAGAAEAAASKVGAFAFGGAASSKSVPLGDAPGPGVAEQYAGLTHCDFAAKPFARLHMRAHSASNFLGVATPLLSVGSCMYVCMDLLRFSTL